MRERTPESGQVTNEWIIIVLLVATVTVLILGIYGRTIASKFSCAARSVSSGQGLTFSCPGDSGGDDTSSPGRDGKSDPANGLPAPSGGSGGAGGSAGGGGSPQDKLEQAKDLVRKTPEGKKLLEFLENNGVDISIGSGDGSFFDDTTGDSIVIDDSESVEDMIFTIPHEATHADRNKSGNTGDLQRDTRDEYIDKMIDEETDATVVAIEIKKDLEAQGETVNTGFPLEQEYRDAFQEKYDELMKDRKSGGKFTSMSKIREEARKAGRDAVRDGFNDGKVLPGTDRNVNYRDFYGRKYDAERTQPNIQPPPAPRGLPAPTGGGTGVSEGDAAIMKDAQDAKEEQRQRLERYVPPRFGQRAGNGDPLTTDDALDLLESGRAVIDGNGESHARFYMDAMGMDPRGPVPAAPPAFVYGNGIRLDRDQLTDEQFDRLRSIIAEQERRKAGSSSN